MFGKILRHRFGKPRLPSPLSAPLWVGGTPRCSFIPAPFDVPITSRAAHLDAMTDNSACRRRAGSASLRRRWLQRRIKSYRTRSFVRLITRRQIQTVNRRHARLFYPRDYSIFPFILHSFTSVDRPCTTPHPCPMHPAARSR